MKIPAKAIRKVINRHFPFRGQDCFIMSSAEYEKRWSNVVADFASEGYPGCGDLLSDERARLDAMRAPPPEDFIVAPSTEASPSDFDDDDDDDIDCTINAITDDSVLYMRLKPEEKKLKWRLVH